ncbi:murein hydrolase activator EnvC family protein [Commensalibacter oyaizuii]|uniref:Peptidoglycan DD-metalloendopeptidase family protein n=1 Tax=Commensalibacter oyaizuii TaxID=3043873 RepID=A0ABT6Q0M1_9PROT|nr:peptidoglycan DD-metalloendopeptidase family protein [Commensalibacter sp. TBRC 16381]MDI2090645.1 peptidoglycan DD-metalloendopeptidase family protein [Commensalibacter sp. TBRC 16381]
MRFFFNYPIQDTLPLSKQVLTFALRGGCIFLLTTSFNSFSSAQSSKTEKTLSAKEAVQKAKEAQQALLKQKQQAAGRLQTLKKQKDEAIKKATKDKAKAEKLNNDMLKATQALQETEQKSAQLSEKIETLKLQIKALNKKLQEESKQFSKFLPLIERLSLYPTDTLLAAPINSSRSTIGLSVIRGISGELEKKAKLIHQHKTELDTLQTQLQDKTKELDNLYKQQETQRDVLAKATKQARLIQQRSSATAFKVSQEAAQAAEKANNLNDAIRKITASRMAAEKRLQAEIRAAEQAKNHAKAEAARKEIKTLATKESGPGLQAVPGKGGSGAPVAGSVITLWGSHTDAGPAQGITYAPQSQASVRAPCGGQIEFAGAFRGYGQMVILNCGKNYRFVLAGMGALNVGVGQSVSKGIMIGRMPSWSGGNTGRPTLFVQLRRGERVINPSPFL